MALKPRVVLLFPTFAVRNNVGGYDFTVYDLPGLVIRSENMDLDDSIDYATKVLEYHVDKKWRKLKRPIPPTLTETAKKYRKNPKALCVPLHVNVMRHIKTSEFRELTVLVPNWWLLNKGANNNALQGIIYGNYLLY